MIAIRAASYTASKLCPGEEAATTGSGDSPWRPYSACSRSDCSVLVGMPVEGPARWTSMMIIGSSSTTARPIVSVLRSSPGPLVHVTPSAPPNAAPSAIDAAAISSSACIVRTPMSCRRASTCSRSDAGVIGYAPYTSGSPLLTDAAISPSAVASVPLTLRYVPGATSTLRSTLTCTSISSDVSPKLHPAWNAARFASRTGPSNLPRIQRSVTSTGRS